MKHKKIILGAILGLLHLWLVTFIVINILNGKEPDWPMYWLILIPFDLPALLLSMLTGWASKPIFTAIAMNFSDASPLSDPVNFWMPLFYFGVLGTLMWYFIPVFIVKMLDIFRKKTPST